MSLKHVFIEILTGLGIAAMFMLFIVGATYLGEIISTLVKGSFHF